MAAGDIGQRDYSLTQIAGYVNSQAEKNCLANGNLRFDECLRWAINVLLDTKEQQVALKGNIDGVSKAELHKAWYKQIWAPDKQAKEALRTRNPDRDKLSPKGSEYSANWC
ncbi:hypothetical protein IWW36_005109, partial [Coemansia brasiliensis]